MVHSGRRPTVLQGLGAAYQSLEVVKGFCLPGAEWKREGKVEWEGGALSNSER